MANLQDVDPKASVEVQMEYRVNLGNYEHVNLNFKLSEVARSGEDGQALLLRVTETVEDLLVEKVNEVRPAKKKS